MIRMPLVGAIMNAPGGIILAGAIVSLVDAIHTLREVPSHACREPATRWWEPTLTEAELPELVTG